MNKLRIVTLAAFLVAGQHHGTAYGADTALTGELVILKGTTNRFRIVDHEGSFIAPPGVSLDTFDGKAVEVQLGNDGQVVQIKEKVIAIAPIEHTIETVTGQLVVVDGARREFSIAGNPRVFVAPEGIDLQLYAGRTMKVRMNDGGQVTALTPAVP